MTYDPLVLIMLWMPGEDGSQGLDMNMSQMEKNLCGCDNREAQTRPSK